MCHLLRIQGQPGEQMKKQWFCVSCVSQIELDTHGRCSTCGSDAVERVAQGAIQMIQQGRVSDRLARRSGPILTTR
jgi:hypothetical protein